MSNDRILNDRKLINEFRFDYFRSDFLRRLYIHQLIATIVFLIKMFTNRFVLFFRRTRSLRKITMVSITERPIHLSVTKGVVTSVSYTYINIAIRRHAGKLDQLFFLDGHFDIFALRLSS